jgi:hypothetical protein
MLAGTNFAGAGDRETLMFWRAIPTVDAGRDA